MNVQLYRLAVALLVFLSPTFSHAQASPTGQPQDTRRVISGVVTDTSGNPLPYVNVIIGSNRVITTDSGAFSLHIAESREFQLAFVRIGFQRVDTTIAPSESEVRVSIRMIPVEVRLSTVRVVAERMSKKLALRGYYDRMNDVQRGINRGYFITPEDLERRRPNMITQMVEGFPSLRVVRAGPTEHYAEIVGTGRCKMTVYLDGIRVVGTLGGKDEYINMIARPSDVAGVEIYPTAVSAPPQYQSLNGGCGVVLIWTR